MERKRSSVGRALYMASGKIKGAFFVVMVVCILVIIVYTQHLVDELRKDSRDIVHFYAQTYKQIASDPIDSETLGWFFENVTRRTNFPLILAERDGTPTSWKDIGIPEDPENAKSPEIMEHVRDFMEKLKDENAPVPITHENVVISYLYYGDSRLIVQLSYLPYITISALGLLVLVAFLGFKSIKKSEQRFIWVGMAKETAHQLGTPISSLLGWLQMLKQEPNDKEHVNTIAKDMESDVKRLEKVAARFSQIGSEATLQKQNIHIILADVIAYIKRRLPHTGREYKLIENYGPIPEIPVNRELFEWAIENLLKNSIDAVRNKTGIIEIVTGRLAENDHIYIDISDNGSGIKAHNKNDIFKAGYSTKKRGWGLGLNLTKRIIEDYHNGKLLIKETHQGKGTTMRILI